MTGEQSLAFSPDGKMIVTGASDIKPGIPSDKATVYDAKTGKLVQELRGQLGGVLSVAFSPDGTRIVTGSRDMAVRVWDVRTGEVLVELKGHTSEVRSVAFTPDGTQIVSAGGDEVYVWDAGTGKELPDEEEIAYRRLYTAPNLGRYRKGYPAVCGPPRTTSRPGSTSISCRPLNRK